MKKIVVILTVLMIVTDLLAQTLTPQQERQFFQKAYLVIRDYAKYAKLQDDQDVEAFLDLFENSNQMICNDLMSLSHERTLSVKEYIRLLYEETDPDMNDVLVWNVQKSGDVWKEDGFWLMSVSFNKWISFLDQCNTFFDSKKIYGDYKLKMTLVWNGKSETCHIRNLEVIGELPNFPMEYKVLNKIDERDNNIDIRGKFLSEVFSNEQVILFEDDVLRYRGAKVKLKKDPRGICENWVIADYQDRSWRMRIGGAYALNGFNIIGSDHGLITTDNNSETSLNVEMGYVFPTTKHLRFGVYIGAGISTNSLTMSFTTPDKNNLQYETLMQYEAHDEIDAKTIDEDGDMYIRKYEFTRGLGEKDIKQDLRATEITIPIYLDMEYEINSNFSIYTDLGLKIQTSNGTMTTTIDEYKTWGEYKKYNGLEIGRDADGEDKYLQLNDFGKHNTIGVDEDGITMKTTVDALFCIGLRVNISKTIAIDAGAQYQVGGSSWVNNGKTDEIFSYTLADGDKVNLLRLAESIKHKSWKVSASIIFKF